MTALSDVLAAYDARLAKEDFPGAKVCLSAALREAEAEHNAAAMVTLYNELMGFERQYGDKAAAEHAARAALRCMETLDMTVSEPAAMVYLNAATVLKVCGKPAEAARLYETAERLFGRFYPAGAKEYAGLYNNMAALFLDTGDFTKAEYYYTRALGLLERHNDTCDLAVTRFNLALLYARRDPCSPFVEEQVDAGMRTLNAPEAVRNAYYYYTCRKCAGAAAEMGFFAAEQELTERADRFYAGH